MSVSVTPSVCICTYVHASGYMREEVNLGCCPPDAVHIVVAEVAFPWPRTRQAGLTDLIDLCVSASSALGLQAHLTTPSVFTGVLRIDIRISSCVGESVLPAEPLAWS